MANVRRISDHLLKISEILKEDLPTEEEYMLIVANLLYTFGITGKERLFPELDVSNANKVELAGMSDPNNPYLAAILQSHILVKWSESLRSNS